MTKEEFREKIKQYEIQVCLNCPFNTCKSGGYACTYLNAKRFQYKKEIKEKLKNEEKNSATNSAQKSNSES